MISPQAQHYLRRQILTMQKEVKKQQLSENDQWQFFRTTIPFLSNYHHIPSDLLKDFQTFYKVFLLMFENETNTLKKQKMEEY